ncbi:MAG: acyltransferase [Candidatus Roizmanbacteria bacterium]|nr:acyltransferase [Candidatus Roizmanbacteria bacterium]
MKDKTGKELSPSEVFEKGINRMGSIGLDFHLMVLRWVGCVPSRKFRKAMYRAAGVEIGKGSTIHMWANFYEPKNITVGDDTIIGDHVFLDGRDQLRIGNHVALASSVMIYNAQHDIDDEHFRPVSKPVVIEDYVFIGPRAIILPGVTVGKGAVVAAGAVVSKDVAPFTVVGGVPAVKIRDRKLTNPLYTLGRARMFQ